MEYYGLRDYGEATETIWGGDKNCNHEWGYIVKERVDYTGFERNRKGLNKFAEILDGHSRNAESKTPPVQKESSFCVKCNAWKGQLGLEPSWRMYVDHMVEVCREIKRVLKKSGSMYIVMGDTYAGSHCGRGDKTLFQNYRRVKVAGNLYDKPSPQENVTDYKPKCLMGISWRVAFTLIDDGWILRNCLIWRKLNSMPSSVKDRYSNTYEFIFFFTKSRKYYFNLDNIREPHKTVFTPFNLRVRDVKRGKGGISAFGELKASKEEVEGYVYPEGGRIRKLIQRLQEIAKQLRGQTNYQGKSVDLQGWQELLSHIKAYREALKILEQEETLTDGEKTLLQDYVQNHVGHPLGKNPGDVILTKHDLAVGRLDGFSYSDPLHVRAYNMKGKNPGDVVKWSNPQSSLVEYFREKGSGGHYDYGGLSSPEGRHEHPFGKNPGDTFLVPLESKFWDADIKTGSPVARSIKTLREGKLTTSIKEKLFDVGAYLKQKRKESGYSFEDLERLTGIKRTTLEHYFRTDLSGQALPDRQTWELLKPLLKLGEYDDFIKEEIKSVLPQPHPLGRNPGDTVKYYQSWDEIKSDKNTQLTIGGQGRFFIWQKEVGRKNNPLGRNPGDYWEICTRPFKGVHFACVDEETECLTRNGWKKWYELTPFDEIATYNIEKDCLEFQRLITIYVYDYDGEMIALLTRDTEFVVTPNHRVIVKKRGRDKPEIVRADELSYKDKILLSARLANNGEGLKVPDEFVQLLGWVVTEGHYVNEDGSIRIYQNEGVNTEEIRGILSKLGYHFREYKQSEEVELDLGAKESREIRHLLPEKRLLPSLVTSLSLKQMKLLLETIVKGDGHRREDGREGIVQKNEINLDAFQILAVLLGYRAIKGKKRRNGVGQIYLTKHKWRGLRSSRGSLLKKIHYTGKVWCPHIPNGTFVARRNGKPFITGNTYPIDIVLRPILSSCPPNGVILDPFCGSGTTMVAAELINHRMWDSFRLPVNKFARSVDWDLKWVGIDLNPDYVEIARERLKPYISQKRLLK